MRNRFPRLIIGIPLLLLIAASMLFAACGDDDDDDSGDDGGSTTAPVGTGEIDISSVPELEDGMLTVGSDIAYPPIEYFEEGTDNATGLDVDLLAAMAEVLGVDYEFKQVADFAAIVGDVKSSRYDIVMSAISITPEREAEIDFIPYFGPAGTGILVQSGNPENIESIEDLCGKAVGAQVGTYQVDQMEGFNSNECAENKIDIKTFPDNPISVQELELGRIVAQLSDDPVAAYSASQSEGGLVEVAVQGFESAPYGIGLRKDSTNLKAALVAALAVIRTNGTYGQILEDWGQSDLALAD
ncbi:MAG: ABC transporter substrate-binding protein [Dehalococcoidia bacterium]